jgi:magnesium transporter
VEVCRRPEQPCVDRTLQPPVLDFIRRIQEEIESLQEVLAFAFEVSL